MSKFKPVYENRLLYKQQYITDDEVHVSSSTYAIRWGLTENTTPVSSRLRITLLYKNESNLITPVQGLIEQWKGEGWTPMDEFASPELVFDLREEFENHMLTMARSFILGVPLNADVGEIDDEPVEPPSKNVLKPKDIKSSKLKPVKSNIKTFSFDKNDEMPEEAKQSGSENIEDDDSDDDEWL